MARPSKTTGIPFHQDSEPEAVCTVDPANPELAAIALVRLVMAFHRKSGCRSYVFVDPDSRSAYVVHEERPSALRWVRERSAWMVGLYGDIRAVTRDTTGLSGRLRRRKAMGVPGLLVTTTALMEDLCDHLGAPLPGAMSTAAPAKPCANGSHPRSGSPRGGCKHLARGTAEAVRHG